MDNKKFELSKSLEFSIPSFTQNLVTDIQARVGEQNKELERIAEENYNNRQKMQKAIEQTSMNTRETNI